MSEVRDGRQYTKTHEWVLANDDGTWTMGISDYAQDLLSDIVFIDLPSVGDRAAIKDGFCVVESVKAASDVVAPADLEVIEINTALDGEPELVNTNCYDAGWLVKFKTDSLDGLMDAASYQKTLD